MDRLKYWFGGRGNSSNQSLNTTPVQDSPGNQGETIATKENLNPSQTTVSLLNEHKKTLPTDMDKTQPKMIEDTELQGVIGWINTKMRQVVPIQGDDCVSCKIIGTTVPLGGALYLIRTGHKRSSELAGRNKVFNVIRYYALAIGLGSVGVARWFDLSIFEPKKEGEKEKTLLDYFKQDLDDIASLANKVKRKFTGPENKDDKDNKT